MRILLGSRCRVISVAEHHVSDLAGFASDGASLRDHPVPALLVRGERLVGLGRHAALVLRCTRGCCGDL